MRYGVPDDDMPDSLQPPGWGPPPFDDRDLDAVLAGETADIPPALRPVVDVLGTLHAPATRAELRGEAAAVAEFRALGLRQAARPAGLTSTLELQMLLADPPPRRVARHRVRRRGPGRVSRLAGTLTAVAALVVLVAAVALTGNLSGPIQRLTGRTAAQSTSHPTGNSASPKTETRSAAVEPTSYPPVTLSATPTQSERSAICREYFGYLKRPEPLSTWAAEASVWQRLTKLAGSGNLERVYDYCAPYVTSLFPHWIPSIAQYPPADQSGAQSGTANQGDTQTGSQNGGSAGGSDQNSSGAAFSG